MNWADWVVRGFALYGVAFFSWQVGRHGVRWVMSEVTGWFSVAKHDFELVELDVKNIETRVKRIEQHPALQIPSLVPPAPPPSEPPKTT